MDLIRQAAAWVTGGFLGSMFLLVALGMLRGSIKTSGLLTVRGANGMRRLSPQQVQLLVITLAGAGQYLMSVIAHPENGLPEVPQQMLALLGLSHASYLGSQGYSLLKKD